MKRFSEHLTSQFDSKKKKLVKLGVLQKAAKAMAEESIEQMQARTNKGIDANSKRLPRFSREYKERKRKIIKSGRYSGEFHAVKTPNHGRLSGQSFRDMKFIIKQTLQKKSKELSIAFEIYVAKRSVPVFKGNARRKREWFGFSTQTARRNKEVAKVHKVGEKIIKKGYRAMGFKVT